MSRRGVTTAAIVAAGVGLVLFAGTFGVVVLVIVTVAGR